MNIFIQTKEDFVQSEEDRAWMIAALIDFIELASGITVTAIQFPDLQSAKVEWPR